MPSKQEAKMSSATRAEKKQAAARQSTENGPHTSAVDIYAPIIDDALAILRAVRPSPAKRDSGDRLRP